MPNPLRVSFFCFNAYALFNPTSSAQLGGAETQMVQIARALEKYGRYEISFIVGSFSQPPVEKFGTIKTFRSIRMQKNLCQYFIAPIIIWRVLAKVNADIFIASPAGPEIGLIALFARLNHKNFVYRTASSVDCTDEKRKTFGFLPGLLYKIGIKLAHAVVVQTTTDKINIMKYYQRSALIIPNVVRTPETTEHASRTDVLWIGSARTVKQPEIFLKLAKKLSQHNFMMVMSKSGDINLWEKTKEQCLSIANLEFVGEVPFAEIGHYFSKAKIIVGTSSYEGFPNVYLQAASIGIPVVSLNVDPEQMFSREQTGYWAEGKIEKLFSYTQKLLTNTKDWQEKSKNARTYVEKYHNTDDIITLWTNLFS